MMKEKTIRTYEGKYGIVTVSEVKENEHIEYHVTHTHPSISAYWSVSKRDAILYAQFLAGKY